MSYEGDCKTARATPGLFNINEYNVLYLDPQEVYIGTSVGRKAGSRIRTGDSLVNTYGVRRGDEILDI